MNLDENPLVRRFEVSPSSVTAAWLAQTQSDVVALLEQNARLSDENERLKRSFTVTFRNKSAALAAIKAAFADKGEALSALEAGTENGKSA